MLLPEHHASSCWIRCHNKIEDTGLKHPRTTLVRNADNMMMMLSHYFSSRAPCPHHPACSADNVRQKARRLLGIGVSRRCPRAEGRRTCFPGSCHLLSTSAKPLQTPGKWQHTAGSKYASVYRYDSSLSIRPCLPFDLNAPTSAAKLSLFFATVTRLLRQHGIHARRATRMHSSSHDCWPDDSPIFAFFFTCILSLMVNSFLKYRSMLPPICGAPPRPHGDASRVSVMRLP